MGEETAQQLSLNCSECIHDCLTNITDVSRKLISQDAEVMSEISEQSRRRAENMTWENILMKVEAVLNVYKDSMNRHQAPSCLIFLGT